MYSRSLLDFRLLDLIKRLSATSPLISKSCLISSVKKASRTSSRHFENLNSDLCRNVEATRSTASVAEWAAESSAKHTIANEKIADDPFVTLIPASPLSSTKTSTNRPSRTNCSAWSTKKPARFPERNPYPGAGCVLPEAGANSVDTRGTRRRQHLSIHAVIKIPVRLRALELVDQEFDRVHRAHRVQDAAQHLPLAELILR